MEPPQPTNWHRNAKFGIIIHWGVYSVPAFDSTEHAKKRKIMNGSEWYLRRLVATFRVGASEKLTKEYHSKEYPHESYADLAKRFTAENWNPNDWANLIARSGARYVLITAKHHDGFCLWKTNTNKDWNSLSTGPKRDILGDFLSAIRSLDARKLPQGIIRAGLYYSWHEWDRTSGVDLCNKEYVSTIVARQIQELATYKPSIVFFDGDWLRGAGHWNSKKAIQTFTKANSECVVNDRLGKNDSWQKLRREDGNMLANYRTFADRTTPTKEQLIQDNQPNPEHKPKRQWAWERVDTIGLSWGRNKQQTVKDYKSLEELIGLLIDVVCKGGCLLLNIGPNSDGTLDKIEVERLECIGRWLEKNGEAIYDTLPYTSSDTVDNTSYTTTKNGKVYKFVKDDVFGGWKFVLLDV